MMFYNLFMDLHEVWSWCKDEKGYSYEIEMPGVSKENITIEVVKEVLVVSYSTRRGTKGNFTLKLPFGVDPDSIEAKLKDGILTLRAMEENKAYKKIEVK
jgi:HSP20 family molecular chaperone IbpA